MTFRPHALAVAVGLLAGTLPLQLPAQESDAIRAAVEARVAAIQQTAGDYNKYDVLIAPGAELLEVNLADDTVTLVFNERLAFRNYLPDAAAQARAELEGAVASVDGAPAKVEIVVRYDRGGGAAAEYSFDEMITTPERMRARQEAMESVKSLAAPVVDRVAYAGPGRVGGLAGRNIVVGPSHGITWHKENRWQFQRARVYTIIEDLFPLSYINPFLAPMLENAGAVVWSVRERDYQTAEVIVDNDGTTRYSTFSTTGDWQPATAPGWKGGRPAVLDQDTEPFTLGTTLRALADPDPDADAPQAVYTPWFPHDGCYAVYLSWAHDPSNSPAVPVTVRHLGGETRFLVNQQVAGNTWVLLDFFEFAKGADDERGAVVVDAAGAAPSAAADGPTYISIDAVRVGGGMGNIAPMDQISHKPRYAEASNYWLQYSGAPADMVYKRQFDVEHFGVDYWSDIAARAEWPNYLHGAPNGPNPVDGTSHRNHPGLGVPVDLYFSWHTDAGFDEVGLIGTLSIYRVFDDIGNDTFPDGRSRWLNRDLTVLVNEEIIRSARALYSSDFNRRFTWERNLGEIRRPNIPSTLLELVSHHNFNDMKYGNDPRFKFDMSRAIYKGILRFIAHSNGYEPVVQPLPPTHVATSVTGEGDITVTWREQPDPLEPSATADGYIVYTSTDGRAFDDGTPVRDNVYTVTGHPGNTSLYFRVTAANAGGQSFPSRVVGARWSPGLEPVLVVDGFDRISGPAIVHEERTHGFDRQRDPGVGFHYNHALVGDQYDFDPKSRWQNDLETPGMGGSQSLHEDVLELGNTFDHVARYGEDLAAAGYPFVSATNDAFAAGLAPRTGAIVWAAGRQKTIDPYPGNWENGAPDLMEPEFPVLTDASVERLESFLEDGGVLLISGAHLGEDLASGSLATPATRRFLENVLGVEAAVAPATSVNSVEIADTAPGALADLEPFRFGRDLERPFNLLPTVYDVPSAESFTVSGGANVMIYGDTREPAMVLRGPVALIGFPLETVLPHERRGEILDAALVTLLGDRAPTFRPEPEQEPDATDTGG